MKMDTAEAMYMTAFDPSHQQGVSALYKEIANEFGSDVFSHTTATITEQSTLPGRYYWVTIAHGQVIGTVGLIIAGEYSVLKSMFVHREYRGQPYLVAACMLETAIVKATSACCDTMYLGTMHRFSAARRFYGKHGFNRIPPESLPKGFPANAVDTVFYCREL